jgi:hypothetical protein
MRKLDPVSLIGPVILFLFLQPSLVSGADMPMAPSTPPSTSSTPPTTSATSPSAVDIAIKAGVHVSIDRQGYTVFSADPSSGVKITALALERLEREKEFYDIGFFIGYVKGFEHFQKGGTYDVLIGGGPSIPKSDNPIADMGEFQGKMAGWQTAKLAKSIKK